MDRVDPGDGEAITCLGVGDVRASHRQRHLAVVGRDVAGHRGDGVGLRTRNRGASDGADSGQVVLVRRAESLEVGDVRHLRTLVGVLAAVANVGPVAQVLRHGQPVLRVHEQRSVAGLISALHQSGFGKRAVIPRKRADLLHHNRGLQGDGLVKDAVNRGRQFFRSSPARITHLVGIAHFPRGQFIQNVVRVAESDRDGPLDDVSLGRAGHVKRVLNRRQHQLLLDEIGVVPALHILGLGEELFRLARNGRVQVVGIREFLEHDFKGV